MPRPDNDRLRFLTREEATRFLSAAETFLTRQRDSTAFCDACALSLYTGMRKSEILGLTVDMINPQAKTVHIYAANSKDGRGGNIPLSDAALDILIRRSAGRTGLIFPGQYGGSRMRRLSHNTRALADKLGLNDGPDPRHHVVFHTFRHTFASWLAMEGVDIYMIMKLMRHKSISQTQRYAKLLPSQELAAVNRIGL